MKQLTECGPNQFLALWLLIGLQTLGIVLLAVDRDRKAARRGSRKQPRTRAKKPRTTNQRRGRG